MPTVDEILQSQGLFAQPAQSQGLFGGFAQSVAPVLQGVGMSLLQGGDLSQAGTFTSQAMGARDKRRSAALREAMLARSLQQDEASRKAVAALPAGLFGGGVTGESIRAAAAADPALARSLISSRIAAKSERPEFSVDRFGRVLNKRTGTFVGQDAGGSDPLVAKAQKEARFGKPPAGFRFKADGTLEAIPGGPATRLPAETAGRLGLANTALKRLDRIERVFLGRKAFGPGFAANFRLNRGSVGRARQDLRLGIEAVLRAATGAAAPESEVQRFLDQFEPTPFDTRETRRAKLERLRATLNNMMAAIQRGRIPGSQSGPTTRRRRFNPQTETLQ